MPGVPIEIASLTPMVLKRMPTSPAASTPAFTSTARRSRCMLHGLPSYHMLQMPTCAFCMSAGVRPVPYSMACDAPWLRGCVICDEYLFMGGAAPGPRKRAGRKDELNGGRLWQLHRVEERHHAAQARADHFNRVRHVLVAQRLVVRHAGLVFGDPLLGELAALDL